MYATVKEFKNTILTGNLEADIKLFEDIFKKDSVFRIKKIKGRNAVSFDAAVLYLDGMVDSTQLDDGVIRPLITVDVENSSPTLADFVETQI